MSAAPESTGRPFATINPYTGETLAEYPFLSSAEVDTVITTAHDAYLRWRELNPTARAQVVRRAGELMMERIDEFTALITLEMGKLIEQSRAEVQLAASILDYYGRRGVEFLQTEPIPVDSGTAEILTEPLGVLLGVEPWNFPLYQVVRFAGPNLVVGNTILLKHAESCPQSALALEQLFRDAGAEEGVYTNVFLRIEDIEQVIGNPHVQGASLTGSEGAGSSIGAIAGKHLKKVVLELGGSDPFLVLDAPDIDHVVQAAAAGRLGNTGQSCIAAKRFIVMDTVYDAFVDRLGSTFSALTPGDPADPATTLGPLSSERAATGLLNQIDDAVTQGATLVTGGKRPDLPGAFVEATVLTDVTPVMRAYSEELFGPAAVVYRVQTDDEAIAIANSTGFGLGAAVFCSDPDRARAVADRIESGMVWINHPTSSEAELPFGGVKRSGFGRELSQIGMFGFANQRLVRTLPPQTETGHIAG